MANSAWPIHHGDPQSTGRSRYLGPSGGSLSWQRDSVYSETGVVIGADSTIYLAGAFGNVGPGLIALTPGGTLKWIFEFASREEGLPTVATPVVAADGTIYVATGGRPALYAVNRDGTLKWKYQPADRVVQHALTIALDGTVCFIDFSGTLYGIAPDGSVNWQVSDPRFYAYEPTWMVFSPDGKTLYMPGNAVTLIAFSLDTRSVKWTYGTTGRQPLPALVDVTGNIYMLCPSDPAAIQRAHLISLASDGRVRWAYVHGNEFGLGNASGLTMNANGEIFFALDTLYSVAYDGSLRWKMELGGWADNPLVCDIEGVVYVTHNRSASEAYEIMAVTSAGQVLWRSPLSPQRPQDASPALTSNGKLVGITYRGGGYVYLLE